MKKLSDEQKQFLKKVDISELEKASEIILKKPDIFFDYIKEDLLRAFPDKSKIIDSVANYLFDELLSFSIKKYFLKYIEINLLPIYAEFDFKRNKRIFQEEYLHRLFMEYSLSEKLVICDLMGIKFDTEKSKMVFLFIADVAYSKLLSKWYSYMY